jgi:hypothetical protein
MGYPFGNLNCHIDILSAYLEYLYLYYNIILQRSFPYSVVPSRVPLHLGSVWFESRKSGAVPFYFLRTEWLRSTFDYFLDFGNRVISFHVWLESIIIPFLVPIQAFRRTSSTTRPCRTHCSPHAPPSYTICIFLFF